MKMLIRFLKTILIQEEINEVGCVSTGKVWPKKAWEKETGASS